MQPHLDRRLAESEGIGDFLGRQLLHIAHDENDAIERRKVTDRPPDAAPGRYAGTLTVTPPGMAPVAVPVLLDVCPWRVPAPSDYRLFVDVIQSPESTALHYRVPLWSDELDELALMGFGFADLVVAVPAFWIDVDDMSDLDAVAADFRARHGHRLRVATKYHRLTRDFFRKSGVADYQLVDSQGATEGAVKNLTAEAVADITSSGATLRDNHLRILSDGLILRSQATLFVSRRADWTGAERGTLDALRGSLGIPA